MNFKADFGFRKFGILVAITALLRKQLHLLCQGAKLPPLISVPEVRGEKRPRGLPRKSQTPVSNRYAPSITILAPIAIGVFPPLYDGFAAAFRGESYVPVNTVDLHVINPRNNPTLHRAGEHEESINHRGEVFERHVSHGMPW